MLWNRLTGKGRKGCSCPACRAELGLHPSCRWTLQQWCTGVPLQKNTPGRANRAKALPPCSRRSCWKGCAWGKCSGAGGDVCEHSSWIAGRGYRAMLPALQECSAPSQGYLQWRLSPPQWNTAAVLFQILVQNFLELEVYKRGKKAAWSDVKVG